MNKAAAMTHVCDGCGATVDAAHMQQRILRLEWATRFRPLHIHTLLLLDAPPEAPADDFYATGESRASVAAHDVPAQNHTGRYTLLGAVARAAGVAGEGKSREEILAGLQRAGVYLAYVKECPVGDGGGVELAAVIGKLILRVRFSYKPKHIVALGENLRAVAPALGEAGFAAERCAGPGDESFERGLGDALRRAGAV